MRTGWVVIALALVACEKKPKEPSTPPISKAPPPEVLPEGTDMTFPTDQPVISMESGGGMDGESRGGIDVWADGSVRWTLDKCTKAPRRGKLPPARVTEIMGALDKAGVFVPRKSKDSDCSDAVYTAVNFRYGGKANTLGTDSCDKDPGSAFKAAMKLIDDAIGTGPCGYPPPPSDEEMLEAMRRSDKLMEDRANGKGVPSPNSSIVQIFIMGGGAPQGGFTIARDGTVHFEDCPQTKTLAPDALKKLSDELGKVPWIPDADHGVYANDTCRITDVIINVTVADVRRRAGCGSKEPADYAAAYALATAAAGDNPCAKK